MLLKFLLRAVQNKNKLIFHLFFSRAKRIAVFPASPSRRCPVTDRTPFPVQQTCFMINWCFDSLHSFPARPHNDRSCSCCGCFYCCCYCCCCDGGRFYDGLFLNAFYMKQFYVQQFPSSAFNTPHSSPIRETVMKHCRLTYNKTIIPLLNSI